MTKQEAHQIISPKNIRKIYGPKALLDDTRTMSWAEIDINLPQDTDGVAESNMFPSSD